MGTPGGIRFMSEIPEGVVLIRHGNTLLAFRRDEYIRAVKRGREIQRYDIEEQRAEERLELTRRRVR